MPRPADIPASSPATHRAGPHALAVCVALAALVWSVFGQTHTFDFVNYDDPANVSENPAVATGLSLGNLVWAFTHVQVGHWDPLTTLSHMAVCQYAGLTPGAHHLANVLFHGFTSILLFLALWQLTAAFGRSAFVAVVFAIHPLRVESVAWVTERKDVLSGLFFMLILAAYGRYVRQPQSAGRYAAVIVLFALGLMCKSMLVTLPFVLLLLDWWPLQRCADPSFEKRATLRWWPLVREKLPLLALSVLACLIQILVNQEGLISVEKIPPLARVSNALVAYATYLRQLIYPVQLSVFYAHPEQTLPLAKILVATLLLLTLSAGAVILRKTQPWLLVGWLWYLGMLLPVIGLIQSGELAHADRYTYLPQIGLCIALTWTVADLTRRCPSRRLLLGSLSIIVIAALAVSAHRQTTHWKGSETLWRHALACDEGNFLAYENLAHALEANGRRDEAIGLRERALTFNPRYHLTLNNLGLNYIDTGRLDEAQALLLRAIEVDPRYAKAENNLGTALLQTGQAEAAIDHFKRALEIKPDFAVAHANLGNAFFRTDRVASAIFHYRKALEIAPDYVKPRANLASALLHTGRTREAVVEFEKTLALQPDHRLAANNLSWILATSADASLRDAPRAVTLAQAASQRAGDKNAAFLRTLAAAYAAAGRFDDAIATAEKALALPADSADAAVRAQLTAEAALYRSGQPFQQTP